MTDEMKTWIIRTIAGHRSAIVSMIVIQSLCGILVSLQPRYFQQLVSLVVGGTGQVLSEGINVVGLLAAIYVATTLLQGLSGTVGVRFSSNLLKQLQVNFFEKTARLPLSYFGRQSSGELFTKFNTDIGLAQKFLASVIPDAIRDLVAAACVTAILLYACPIVLTMTAFAIALAAALAILKLNQAMSAYAADQRKGWSLINRTFDETVRGIDTLKTFRAEPQMRTIFLAHTTRFRELCIRAGTFVAIASPAIELITKLGGLLPLFLAYYLISKGNIDLAPFLLFFFYAALLQMSISNLIAKLANVQNEMAGIRNLAAFFSERTETDDARRFMGQVIGAASVTMTGISFAYPGGRRLYRKADLTIPGKAITVIHGKSGSGKSTLINLLLKFHVVDEGTIHIGDVDLSTISQSDLRSAIGVVTQNHFIFQDTLRENLRIAKSDATDHQILAALDAALLGDFVKRLPEGLDTVMQFQGKGLSGGEKQRLCIARLLLRGSSLMILDEPWSNLDLPARIDLAKVLNASKREATILILTHDVSPVLSVDRSYRLVAATGKFEVIDHAAVSEEVVTCGD